LHGCGASVFLKEMKIKQLLHPTNRLVIFSAVSAIFSLSVHATDPSAETTEGESSPWLFGYMVSQQLGLDDLGFTTDEKSEFLTGLQKGLDGGSMEAIEGQLPQLQQFLQTRAMAAQAKEMALMQEEAASFVEELENNPDVKKDESGFYYEVIEEGDGDAPTMSDEVVVNYEGSLIDGSVFDSSYQRGEPAVFPMGGVIPGFSGGLSKVSEGGKVRIYIPAELGYGDNPPPNSPIPPGAMLIFDAEIVEVVSPDSAE